MRPEIPYLLAGAFIVGSSLAREKKWPSNGTRAVLATIVLVVIASVSDGTKVAPLVRAFGFLMLIVAVLTFTPIKGMGKKT